MHGGQLRLEYRHNQNMKHLLLFHGNNGYANAPQCHAVRTLPLFFKVGQPVTAERKLH
jgi:hypothetical protein